MPHNSVQIFIMGNAKNAYDTRLDLVANEGVQIRDNSLESARQAINKYLEKHAPGAYFLRVRVFPHNVIRENKMILGAGADRLQKGMRKAYGRPTDRGARVPAQQAIFTLLIDSKNRKLADEAYRRAKLKLPGRFSVDITKNNI
ncbi:50S ribosomal protein L10e [Candidatus Burarchaeum australiense]|nr:50S ribosomal protein L10e [Candidatus Burarchaeum australiense]